MEENNSNSVFKVLVIILVVLLGINMYRTELIDQQLSKIEEAFEQGQAVQVITEVPSAKSVTPTPNRESSSSSRVSVSAKVKVENRYVVGTTYLPKVTTGPEGVVVVDVTIDEIGIVTAASLNTSSTVKNEEIVDLCKEAALKTKFSYNPGAAGRVKGRITYTFSSK